MEAREQLVSQFPPFAMWLLGDQIQIIRLDGRHLYPLSYLPGLGFDFEERNLRSTSNHKGDAAFQNLQTWAVRWLSR